LHIFIVLNIRGLNLSEINKIDRMILQIPAYQAKAKLFIVHY